jgi:hypothetical protein
VGDSELEGERENSGAEAAAGHEEGDAVRSLTMRAEPKQSRE